ncbi:hypothetical protein ACFQ2B_30400 [Streptomyces stramineus]
MGSAEAQRLLDAVAAGHLTTQPGWAGSRGYVPTEVSAGPAPTPPPAPAGPSPGFVPAPGPGPAPGAGSGAGLGAVAVSGSVSGPAVPLYGRPTHSGAFPAPGGTPAATGPSAGFPVARPASEPGRLRTKVMPFLGPLLALLLIAGGTTAAILSVQDAGNDRPGTSGGQSGATTSPTDDAAGPDSGTGPTANPSAGTATPGGVPAGSTPGSCNGGWLSTCGPE